MDIWTVILRLSLATILGGLVGMERENKKRAAGFRTHILVSLGAALVMVTSEFIFEKYQGLTNLDPARLGAQVISGIGFLGAGTIIRQGISIKGLTTAASLWAVSCIGLATGCGFYIAAVAASIIVFVTLILLGRFEKAIINKTASSGELYLKLENRPGKVGEVATLFGNLGVKIDNIEFLDDEESGLLVKFNLLIPKGQTRQAILTGIKLLDGVTVIE